MGLLFVPIVLGASSIYVWARPEVVAADALLHKKASSSNLPFFTARAVFYFAVWGLLAWRVSSWSRRQDGRSGPRPRRAAARGSRAVGLVLLSLTTTLRRDRLGDVARPPLVLHHLRRPLHRRAGRSAPSPSPSSSSPGSPGRSPSPRALQPVHGPRPRQAPPRLHHALGYMNFSQFLIIWSGNLQRGDAVLPRRLQGGWQQWSRSPCSSSTSPCPSRCCSRGRSSAARGRWARWRR